MTTKQLPVKFTRAPLNATFFLSIVTSERMDKKCKLYLHYYVICCRCNTVRKTVVSTVLGTKIVQIVQICLYITHLDRG